MVKKIFGFQDKDGKLIEDNCTDSTRYVNVKLGKNGIAQIRRNADFLESKKNLPELYSNKNMCCGCTACYSICPQSDKESDMFFVFRLTKNSEEQELPFRGAISMLPDEEGFLYPVVDAEKCIRCYKCLQVCPYKD